MSQDKDLKTLQFAAVFQQLDNDTGAQPGFVSLTHETLCTLSDNTYILGIFVGIMSALIILCLRPPFAVKFEIDRRKPWQAKSSVSWTVVLCVSILSALAVVIIPLCVCYLNKSK